MPLRLAVFRVPVILPSHRCMQAPREIFPTSPWQLQDAPTRIHPHPHAVTAVRVCQPRHIAPNWRGWREAEGQGRLVPVWPWQVLQCLSLPVSQLPRTAAPIFPTLEGSRAVVHITLPLTLLLVHQQEHCPVWHTHSYSSTVVGAGQQLPDRAEERWQVA